MASRLWWDLSTGAMISGMAHVTTGCRDCKKCTNSGVANLGRNSGRLGAGILTLGISEGVMAATKNCRICGHKLSLHSAGAAADAASARPSRPKKAGVAQWYPEAGTGRMRWFDGLEWGVYKDDWDAQLAAENEPSTEVAAASSGPDLGARLAKLAELHTAGALTDDEFAAAKQQVLGLG